MQRKRSLSVFPIIMFENWWLSIGSDLIGLRNDRYFSKYSGNFFGGMRGRGKPDSRATKEKAGGDG